MTASSLSGDGDTASIGIGQFIHAVERNQHGPLRCGGNGVYGLTKGSVLQR